MTNYFITFRSVTFAQRGESVLGREGISCRVQRTPRWMEEQGCGYCLTVKPEDAPRAAALLRENQVSYRKVYRQLPGGGAEETAV